MKLLRRYRYIVGLPIAVIMVYYFLESVSNANHGLLDDLLGSVSGTVRSVARCEVHSTEISQVCIELDEGAKRTFIDDVHQAKPSLRPGHSIVAKEYLIKVAFVGKHKTVENNKCFLVQKLEGVDDIFLANIDAGENCSHSPFRYLEGTVKVPNFLFQANSVNKNIK